MSRPTELADSHWDFDPSQWPDEDCVAAGADLRPETLIGAYRLGAFPMPVDGRLLWWSPMERGVLLPGQFKASRSLRKSARKFAVTMDNAFEDVVDGCADPSRSGAWIDADIRAAYLELARLGWAHSVEVWSGSELVGGLYGVSIGRLFAGESMFHRRTDASKAALLALVDHLEAQFPGSWLIDTQWPTEHLQSLGVSTMVRSQYLAALPALVDGEPLSWSSAPFG